MKLEILNPVARKQDKQSSAAARLSGLDGKSIGLYWNHRSGGDVALRRASELLRSQYPKLETKNVSGSMGGHGHYLTTEDAKRIAGECTAVIASTAD
jgi:hypothetical protein